MSPQQKRRAAALLEVLGVFLTGLYLRYEMVQWLVRHKLVNTTSAYDLLTAHASNADLLLASRQTALSLGLQYGAYALLIIPIGWWYRRTGPAAYGLTRAGYSWSRLLVIGLAAACLCEWPVPIQILVNTFHPLGATVPWRQAFEDMSWLRWQFWMYAAIASYAVIPVVEELVFRGYYQRRLAEDWGDAPAIVGTACMFTFAHDQYLHANAYNAAMIVALLIGAVGFGVVFAWTRSLVPGIVAHAIIDVPMTPFWRGVLLAFFIIGIFFAWRGGVAAMKKVFADAKVAACVVLAAVQTAYVIASGRIDAVVYVSIGMLVAAVGLEAADRRRRREKQPDDAGPGGEAPTSPAGAAASR